MRSSATRSARRRDRRRGERIGGPAAYFAWYVPYLASDAEAACDWAVRRSPWARKFELCRSEEGRPVWGLRVTGPGDAARRPVVWIHARQHA